MVILSVVLHTTASPSKSLWGTKATETVKYRNYYNAFVCFLSTTVYNNYMPLNDFHSWIKHVIIKYSYPLCNIFVWYFPSKGFQIFGKQYISGSNYTRHMITNVAFHIICLHNGQTQFKCFLPISAQNDNHFYAEPGYGWKTQIVLLNKTHSIHWKRNNWLFAQPKNNLIYMPWCLELRLPHYDEWP